MIVMKLIDLLSTSHHQNTSKYTDMVELHLQFYTMCLIIKEMIQIITWLNRF